MRVLISAICIGVIMAGGPALAETPSAIAPVSIAASNNPQIDFPGYVEIAQTVQNRRAERLVDLATFQAMAAEPGTLLLDARSAAAFAQGQHGADFGDEVEGVELE